MPTVTLNTDTSAQPVDTIDLPDLPPAAQLETRPVRKACIEARAALAALQQAARLIPNPAVLINTMPLLEAQASSAIENIVTTSDALFRYAQLDERAADPATREALRNRTALNSAFHLIKTRPLSTATAVEVCTGIKNVQMEIRRIPGTALANSKTGKVIYTPPVGEALLRDKLANWEKFVHGEDNLDPLVRMAVAHYQFEAIHPFIDGNGRTGPTTIAFCWTSPSARHGNPGISTCWLPCSTRPGGPRSESPL